jgi:hypothetical protein
VKRLVMAVCGPSPTCGGEPCAPGCWCHSRILFVDSGNGGTATECSCGEPAPPPALIGDGIYCCGGVYCPYEPSYPLATCSAQNDCSFVY